MRKALYIVCLIGLTACSTTTVIPIDDVYYTPSAESKTQNTQINQSTQSVQSSPTSIEYLNVQDTTVTIRIKK